MTKRMLIDATHAEETRVVVLDGSRLEDFDVETSAKRQLKGNIYLAKVVRVEPSLQAAFVEYGGNRHGFLAFGEIHPDYYQIPVADRQRLIEQEAEEARLEEEEEDRAAEAEHGDGIGPIAERAGRDRPRRSGRNRTPSCADGAKQSSACRGAAVEITGEVISAPFEAAEPAVGSGGTAPSTRPRAPTRIRPIHDALRCWSAEPPTDPIDDAVGGRATRHRHDRRRSDPRAAAAGDRRRRGRRRRGSRASAASRRASCATTRSRR